MNKKISVPVLAAVISVLIFSVLVSYVPDAKASTSSQSTAIAAAAGTGSVKQYSSSSGVHVLSPGIPVPFQAGDIFAGIGSGKIAEYSSSGVIRNTIDTTTGSLEETGMCFDPAGDIYTTNFESGTMSKFDNHGNLLSASWGGPFSAHPESCVLDKAGNIYVGEVDGRNQILKFNQSGTLLASYSPRTESRGLDWIDLASDQCTMYYTSEGSGVHRFNVCTNTQLPDFVTGLSGPAYALRILNNTGDVLVASTNQLYRISSAGAILHVYPKPSGETSILFAMNVDPDGKTFWTAGYNSGNIYHIDIATGTILAQFNAAHTFSVAGLAVFGEKTVGCEPNCPKPVTVTTHLSSSSIVLGGSFTDNATLTNVTPNATGTITYNVYKAPTNCIGTPLFTSTTPVTDAKATPSSPFKPTVLGTYNVQAVYSGDTNNHGASSDCTDEQVTVSSTTTSFTAVQTGIWNNPDVWEEDKVPGPSDKVIIPSKISVTIPSAYTVKIGPGGTVTVYGIIYNKGAMINSGTMTNPGGIIHNIFPNSTITNNGIIKSNGKILNSGKITNSGTLTINSVGNMTNNKFGIITNLGGTINNISGGTITNNGVIHKSTGTINGPILGNPPVP